jgi:hypothetical protein
MIVSLIRPFRHCEPPGPARSGRPDAKLSKAILAGSAAPECFVAVAPRIGEPEINHRVLKPMRARVAALALMAMLTAGTVLAQQNSQPSWPPLPTTGFISGRAATDKDVAEGNAVFVLRAYGTAFGKPLDVVIPQYAYLTKNGQQKLPVIVVQAEEGKGIKIFGIRDFTGSTATAKQSELQLLGTHPAD